MKELREITKATIPQQISDDIERKGFTTRRKTRYGPYWIWEVDEPFSLAQADTKGILDKGTFKAMDSPIPLILRMGRSFLRR